MCRLPAGQTTFAISNSFLPYTCTCCEINYAFSSCQARKRALLSKWVGGRKIWKGAQGGADGENPSVCPHSKSLVLLPLSLKTMRQSLHVVNCSPLRKSGFTSTLLFHLPEVTLACLIPAAVVCSQQESHLLHSVWLKALFNEDDVSALRVHFCSDFAEM